MKERRTCQECRHFDNEAASLEKRLPGLTIFGSAYSSARGEAGICALSGRYLDAIKDCDSFEREEVSPQAKKAATAKQIA
jgi:hypothetical protein